MKKEIVKQNNSEEVELSSIPSGQLNEQQINEQLDKQLADLKAKYPKEFERRIKQYNDMKLLSMSVDRIDKIMEIIMRYEKFEFYVNYKINNYIFNIGKIYSDYYKQYPDNEEFIEDLILLYGFGYIDIEIPDLKVDSFRKPNYNYSPWLRETSMFYKFIENICLIEAHIKNGKTKLDAIIFFTKNGVQYKIDHLIEHLLVDAMDKQKEIVNEQNNIKSRVENYSKEIISIVAIILAVAPLIVINISALNNINLKDILVINGCLINGITTIFAVVSIIYNNKSKKHFFLLIPGFIGIGLIFLSLLF